VEQFSWMRFRRRSSASANHRGVLRSCRKRNLSRIQDRSRRSCRRAIALPVYSCARPRRCACQSFPPCECCVRIDGLRRGHQRAAPTMLAQRARASAAAGAVPPRERAAFAQACGHRGPSNVASHAGERARRPSEHRHAKRRPPAPHLGVSTARARSCVDTPVAESTGA